MSLIYLSPVPWASFSQRPHKFVAWFYERTGRRVFWVEPYAVRFPRWSDLQRVTAAKAHEQEAPPPWLCVLKSTALPIEPLPGSGAVNAMFWTPLVRQLQARTSGQETLLVAGKPCVLALHLLDALRPSRSVYDAMDDFPAFHTGIARTAMVRREALLVKRVDELWVSSTVLKQRWSRDGRNMRFVPNALDGEALPSPRSSQTEGVPKVFGYVGTIAAWFDWQWVITLARLRSTDIVRLIGPVFGAVPANLPSNIELLPACHHRAALEAMREFDVGLIPFKKTELTASVDPIKYYEYRAMGLPILSTDFGEMTFRSGEVGVFICKNILDISHAASIATHFFMASEVSAEFSRLNTWPARFDSIGTLGANVL